MVKVKDINFTSVFLKKSVIASKIIAHAFFGMAFVFEINIV